MRITRSLQLSPLFLAIALQVNSAAAGTFAANFDDGTSGGLLTSTAGTGFSSSVSGGVLITSKSAGDSSNGGIYNFTSFNISGDFVAIVDAHRNDLSGGGVYEFIFGDNNAIIRFRGNGQIEGAIQSGSVPLNLQSVNNSAAQAKFQIIRSGNTISEFYNLRGGPTLLNSVTDASLVLGGQITLAQQRFTGTSVAESGFFDNLIISGPSVPEPSCLMGAFVCMCSLPRRARRPNPRNRS